MFIRCLSDVIRCLSDVLYTSPILLIWLAEFYNLYQSYTSRRLMTSYKKPWHVQLIRAWDNQQNMLDMSNQIKHKRRWVCPVIDDYDGLHVVYLLAFRFVVVLTVGFVMLFVYDVCQDCFLWCGGSFLWARRVFVREFLFICTTEITMPIYLYYLWDVYEMMFMRCLWDVIRRYQMLSDVIRCYQIS